MNKNNTIVAAPADIEAARNLKIYNALANIAREVFDHIETAPGTILTPAEIAAAIVGGPVVSCVNGLNYRCDRVEKYQIGAGLKFAEGYNADTVYNVAVDGFSCTVNGWRVFSVLERAARSWNIAPADRVIFEKKSAAPVVVSLTLSAAAARELCAMCADDVLRPVLTGIFLDIRRRCLVSCNGHVMRVFMCGSSLVVNESAAAPGYIIPAAVIKSGRVVTITADGIASTDKKSAPTIAGRFPNWAGVIPGASGRVDITADQWKQIKKAVADVAKVHPGGKGAQRRVIIAHESYSNNLVIYAKNVDFSREREINVKIDSAAPAFSMSFNADYFIKIAGTPTAFYIKDNCRAIVATDAAGLSLVMPLMQLDDDKYNIYFNFAEAVADYLPGVDIAAAAAEMKEENEAAAAADILERVREECKGKTAAKMLKYINENFGWSPGLDRARAILQKEIEEEKNAANDDSAAPSEAPAVVPAAVDDTTAAPSEAAEAVEISTPANDDTPAPAAENVETVTSAAPADVVPVPGLDTTATINGINFDFAPYMEKPAQYNDAFADLINNLNNPEIAETAKNEIEARALAAAHSFAAGLGMARHAAAAVELTQIFLVNVLNFAAMEKEDSAAPSMAPAVPVDDVETETSNDSPAPAAAVPAAVVFVDVCETPANDDSAAPGSAAAPVEISAPVHFFAPSEALKTAAPIMTAPTMKKRPTGQIKRHRARRWFRVAAAAACLFLISLISGIERETPATAAPALVPVMVSTPANDDTPAPAAVDDTTAAPSEAAEAGEISTAADDVANVPTSRNEARAHHTTPAPAAVVPVVVPADTLENARNITETSDSAAAVVSLDAADEITAAPSEAAETGESSTPADDDAAPVLTDTNDDETSTPAPADDTTNEEPAPTTGATGTTAAPATLAPVLVAAGVPAVLIPYIIAAF